MPPFIDYYEILEVHPKASLEVIKKAYGVLAKKYHPDTTAANLKEANAKMRLINEAYSVLSDDIKRKNYDLTYFNANTAETSTNTTSNNQQQNSKAKSESNSTSGQNPDDLRILLRLCVTITEELREQIRHDENFAKSNKTICEKYFAFLEQKITPVFLKIQNTSKNQKVLLEANEVYATAVSKLGYAYTWANDFIKAEELLVQSIDLAKHNPKMLDKYCDDLAAFRKGAELQRKKESENNNKKKWEPPRNANKDNWETVRREQDKKNNYFLIGKELSVFSFMMIVAFVFIIFILSITNYAFAPTPSSITANSVNTDIAKTNNAPVTANVSKNSNLPQIYKDNEYGFSFRYPENWSKTKTQYNTRIEVVSPLDQNNTRASMNIVVNEALPDLLKTPKEFFVDMYKKITDEFILLRFEKCKLAGQDGLVMVYGATLGGKKIGGKQYVVNYGKKMYIITFTHTLSNFLEYEKIFDDIADSIVLKTS